MSLNATRVHLRNSTWNPKVFQKKSWSSAAQRRVYIAILLFSRVAPSFFSSGRTQARFRDCPFLVLSKTLKQLRLFPRGHQGTGETWGGVNPTVSRLLQLSFPENKRNLLIKLSQRQGVFDINLNTYTSGDVGKIRIGQEYGCHHFFLNSWVAAIVQVSLSLRGWAPIVYSYSFSVRRKIVKPFFGTRNKRKTDGWDIRTRYWSWTSLNSAVYKTILQVLIIALETMFMRKFSFHPAIICHPKFLQMAGHSAEH